MELLPILFMIVLFQVLFYVSWYATVPVHKRYVPLCNKDIFNAEDISTLTIEKHEKGPLCTDENTTYVILFSYMRSGSTLTGELLKNNHDIFYVYEPLHNLANRVPSIKAIRELIPRYSDNSKVVDVLEGVLGCNFTEDERSIRSPLSDVTVAKSYYLDDFRKCREGKEYHLDECSKKLHTLCKQFRTRAIKVIRSTMEDIELLLERNKGCAERFKIIHLLRDPRGKINSHLHLPSALYSFNSGIGDFINICCSRIMQDIAVRKKLEGLYPNTFFEVHYETIADSLLSSTESIYKFIQTQKPPVEVYSFVHSLLHHDNTQQLVKAIRRSNSSETASNWKSQLDVDQLRTIEMSSCRSIISYLNGTIITK